MSELSITSSTVESNDSLFEGNDREGNNVNQRSYLLRLPQALRCEIWKRVHYKHFRNLRLTCQQIANDIDHHLGISALIDETELEFDEYFEALGIRQATILCLPNFKIEAVLLHPKLLVSLLIEGHISTPYFTYFMRSCDQISSLTIDFGKKALLKAKPTLFPQPIFQHCLPHLKSLKICSTTKKDHDLKYVCDNITGITKHTLSYDNQLLYLNFELSHKNSSPYLEELILEVIVLVHKQSEWLREFSLSVQYSGHTNQESSKTSGNDDDGGVRRGTSFIKLRESLKKENAPSVKKPKIISRGPAKVIASPTLQQAVEFRSDKRHSRILEDAEKYLKRARWGLLPHLKKINIAVSSNCFNYLQEMLCNCKNLNYLKLEMNSGVVINCWILFSNIIEEIGGKLTTIKLVRVSYEDYLKNPMDIDLSVFKHCKSLKILHFSCPKRETHRIPKAKKISSLPKTLQHIEIFWVSFSPWQIFRLLYCFKKLFQLSLAYSSSTDKGFGWSLWVLKLLISWNLTKVQIVNITDLKIRFRNKRAAVKSLRKSVPVQIEYRDREETCLVVDRGRVRRSDHSIPSINSY